MQRRELLKSALTLSLAAATLSSAGCLPVFNSPEERLYQQLGYIFEAHFSTLAENVSAAEIKARLIEKKVIDKEGNILTQRVQSLALEDPMMPHNKYYYTETELELYTLAYLLHSKA